MLSLGQMTSKERILPAMRGGMPDEVEKDVIRCLDAGKAGGGYILFTEEGLGRDTPFANIQRFVEVGKRLGSYKSSP